MCEVTTPGTALGDFTQLLQCAASTPTNAWVLRLQQVHHYLLQEVVNWFQVRGCDAMLCYTYCPPFVVTGRGHCEAGRGPPAPSR